MHLADTPTTSWTCLLVPTIQHMPAIRSAFTCPIESIRKTYLSAFIFDCVCLVWNLCLASCGIFIFLLWQSLSYHMWSWILLHVWELHSDVSHKSQILPYLLNYDRASWCWYYWWFGSNNYSLWGYTVFFPTWPDLVLLGNLMSLCSKKVTILLSDFMGTFNSYST